jgi:hypothetical protein
VSWQDYEPVRSSSRSEKLMPSLIVKVLGIAAVVVCSFVFVLAQNDDRWQIVDEFGPLVSDDLLARVDNFQATLAKRNDAKGLVILYGPRIAQYINQRRIEGCNMMLKHPTDRLRFVFAPDVQKEKTKLILVAKDANIHVDPPSYQLPGLRRPIELNSAFGTDEFCPRHFDVDWFSQFMKANPDFRGRVIIDSSRNEFTLRAAKYRSDLEKLLVSPARVTFLRRRFVRERDEQWWLIPPTKK